MKQKITISGIIGWDVTASDVKNQIKEFKPTDELEVEVNSPGGSVFEGIEIFNAIKSHPGKTTTIATSITASMGSYIMMSGDIGRKKAFENASFMIHNVSSFSFGDHRAFRKAANVIESLTNVISKPYITQTGKEKSEILGLMDDETWFFGDEILNAGLVDEIIPVNEEEKEDKEEALAFQKLVFIDCQEKLSKAENKDDELNKLAAYFNSQSKPLQSKKADMTPEQFLAFLAKNPEAETAFKTSIEVAKTEAKTETKDLKLDEILALSATAKTEHDQLIETTKIQASTEIESGKLSKADALFIGQVCTSDAYGKSVHGIGIDCYTGDSDMKIFKMVVALADEQNEKIKSLQIQKKQPKGTPGDLQNNAADDTSLESPQISATIENLKKIVGV